MTTLTPAEQERSARFEAHLRGWYLCDAPHYGVQNHVLIAEKKPIPSGNLGTICRGGTHIDPLDPTTPEGQLAAAELLKTIGSRQYPLLRPFEDGEWFVSMDEEAMKLPTLGAAITAAWMDAAAKWEATATPSGAAG